MTPRPAPKLERERSPALLMNRRAARMAAIESIIEPKEAGVRPRALSRGAAEAQKRHALKARSEAAKLDIMAKRRDEADRGH